MDIPGIYVNKNAQLLILSFVDENKVSVLTSGDKVGSVTVTYEVNVEMDDEKGVYQRDVDAIQWDNGDQWSRIQMSHQQYRMITRRPFIPLTFLAFMMLKDFATRSMEAVVAFGAWTFVKKDRIM